MQIKWKVVGGIPEQGAPQTSWIRRPTEHEHPPTCHNVDWQHLEPITNIVLVNAYFVQPKSRLPPMVPCKLFHEGAQLGPLDRRVVVPGKGFANANANARESKGKEGGGERRGKQTRGRGSEGARCLQQKAHGAP